MSAKRSVLRQMKELMQRNLRNAIQINKIKLDLNARD
jgi:hypothetical protein